MWWWSSRVCTWLSVWLCLAAAAAADHPQEPEQHRAIPIAGYLPDYRVAGFDAAAVAPVLSDLFLFSVEISPHPHQEKSCCLQPGHYEAARAARDDHHHGLGLWVTLGGQGRTHDWREILSDHDFRRGFLDAVTALARQHRLKGIDLDLFAFVRRQEEADVFWGFLEEASRVWRDQHGLQLSLPLHPGRTLSPKAYGLVDRVHLMAYEAPGGMMTRPALAEAAVDRLLSSGCPPHKVWLGIPWYAQGPEGTSALGDALLRAGNGPPLEDGSLPEAWHWDSPSVVRAKAALVRSRDLAGLFVWELGQDRATASHPTGLALSVLVEAAAGASDEADPEL